MWTEGPFTPGQAWVDLILLANPFDSIMEIRGIKVAVKRGEVGWSENRLADRWKWSRSKTSRFLKNLQSDDQIKIKNAQVFIERAPKSATPIKSTPNKQKTIQETTAKQIDLIKSTPYEKTAQKIGKSPENAISITPDDSNSYKDSIPKITPKEQQKGQQNEQQKIKITTIISIVNWEEYQVDEQQKKQENEHRGRSLYKKEKKEKKEKDVENLFEKPKAKGKPKAKPEIKTAEHLSQDLEIKELKFKLKINEQAWGEFEAYRTRKRKPLEFHARKLNLRELKDCSFAEQQRIIDKTMRNEWTGLFGTGKSSQIPLNETIKYLTDDDN